MGGPVDWVAFRDRCKHKPVEGHFWVVFSGTTSHFPWESTNSVHPAASVHLVVCCFPVKEKAP